MEKKTDYTTAAENESEQQRNLYLLSRVAQRNAEVTPQSKSRNNVLLVLYYCIKSVHLITQRP